MKNPGRSIHRLLLLRLVPVWLGLSLLAAGLAYWVESRRMDAYAQNLAASAALRVQARADEALRSPKGVQAALDALLAQEPLIGMRFYDALGKLNLEAWTPAEQGTAKRLAGRPEALGGSRRAVVRTGGRLVIGALVPLTVRGSTGWMEGFYAVPPEEAAEMGARIRRTLLLTLVVVALTALVLYPVAVGLHRDTQRLSRNLLGTTVDVVSVLGRAIAKRDVETNLHNYRVTLYAIRLAQTLGRPVDEVVDLFAGAFLHDIGKLGIPDGILRKPGALSPEEFAIMKTHVTLGEEILRDVPWLGRSMEVVACHHEQYGGGGYPKGLAGSAIPAKARIFSIADAFDALASARPYKKALPLEEVLDLMRAKCGTQFDPAFFAAFERKAGYWLRRYGSMDEASLRGVLVILLRPYLPRIQAEVSAEDRGFMLLRS